MDVRRLGNEKGWRRRGLVAIAAVGVAAAMWVAWEGPLMALSSPDMAEWVEWVGEEPEGLDSVCRGTFDEDGRGLYCERLRHSLPVAQAHTTSAFVKADEETGEVRALGFHVEPFRPSFETTPEGMVRLVTWSEMVQDHVDVGDCAPRKIPHCEFGAWDCEDYVVVHSGMMAETPGRLSVTLWIGRTWEDVEEAVSRRAEIEHRQRAGQLRRAAADYLMLGYEDRAAEKLKRVGDCRKGDVGFRWR